MNRLCAITMISLSLVLAACGASDSTRSLSPNDAVSPTEARLDGDEPVERPAADTPVDGSTVDAPQAAAEVAIYLASENFTTAQLLPESGVLDLAAIPLEAEPVLTQDDIVRYNAETHAFSLTPEAIARLEALQLPVSGPVFVLTVGPDRIYAGAFWTPLSSRSFDGIVILGLPGLSLEGYDYRIDLGYASPGLYPGPDPRDDPRILQALEQGQTLDYGELSSP